jgi:hypothetical protein
MERKVMESAGGRFVKPSLVTVGALLMLCGTLTAAGAPTTRPAAKDHEPPRAEVRGGPIISESAIYYVLKAEVFADDLWEKLHRWQVDPLYVRVSVAERLLPYLAKDDRVKTVIYKWEPGTHDLNRVAGRAAAAFDRLVGCNLTSVTPGATPEDLLTLRRDATDVFHFWRKTILNTIAELPPGKSTDELRKEYHGKIQTRNLRRDAAPACERMHRLLLDWFPIGKEMAEFHRITGAEGERVKDMAVFHFDTGISRYLIRLHVKDGIIWGVSFDAH